MRKHPKFHAERQRLEAQLIHQKNQIRQDLADIRDGLTPIRIVKNVAGEAIESLRENSVASQTVRLGLNMFTRRFKNPIWSVVAQLAVPMLLRNVPRISHYIAEKLNKHGLGGGARLVMRYFQD